MTIRIQRCVGCDEVRAEKDLPYEVEYFTAQLGSYMVRICEPCYVKFGGEVETPTDPNTEPATPKLTGRSRSRNRQFQE